MIVAYGMTTILVYGSIFNGLRNKMKIDNKFALFFTINGNVPNSTQTMHNLYEEYKERDGFLYVVYTSENTFGV
jgi:GABA(A) receptor-associated protein